MTKIFNEVSTKRLPGKTQLVTKPTEIPHSPSWSRFFPATDVERALSSCCEHSQVMKPKIIGRMCECFFPGRDQPEHQACGGFAADTFVARTRRTPQAPTTLWPPDTLDARGRGGREGETDRQTVQITLPYAHTHDLRPCGFRSGPSFVGRGPMAFFWMHGAVCV